MKISLSTKVLGKTDLKESLLMIAEKGYHGAEIWADQVYRDIDDLYAFKKYLRKLQLDITLHAPTGDLNISSTNEEIRAISVRQTESSIELAARLEVALVTVHPGRKTSSKDDPELNRNLQVESLDKLLRTAERNGVCLGIENMEQRKNETIVYPQEVNRLLEIVGSNNLGITLDIAHAVTIPDMDIYEYIREIKKILHVHISDSTEAITHLPLGWGKLDLQ